MLPQLTSFKYKMVFFALILVGGCLGIFLFYVLNYFESDKKAYIFEEAHKSGLELGDQLRREVDTLKSTSTSIQAGFLPDFRGLHKDLLSIKIKDFGGEKVFLNDVFLKKLGLKYDQLKESLPSDSVGFISLLGNENGFLALKDSHSSRAVTLLAYPKSFLTLLNSKTSTSSILFDAKTGKKIFWNKNFDFAFNKRDFTTDSPRTFEAKINKKKSIVTLYPIDVLGAVLVSSFDLQKSTQTLDDLKATIIWACVGLLGFGIILATFFAKALASPIERMASMVLEVTQGDLNARAVIESRDETGILGRGLNQMMDKIQSLISEVKEKVRLESELKLASLVQRNFFDLAPVKTSSIDLVGDYISASECAGDWWCAKNWDQKYVMMIGDATGHGAHSALLTSAVFSAVACMEKEMISRPLWWERPDFIMERLNKVLISMRSELMMTFLIGIYDPDGACLYLCNSSHEFPVIIRGDKKPQHFNDIDFLVSQTSPRLGEIESPTFYVDRFPIEASSRLVFYTDGLIEAHATIENPTSERNFMKKVIEISTIPIKDCVNVLTPNASLRLNDDVSYFVVDLLVNPSGLNFLLEDSVFKDIKMNRTPIEAQHGFLVGDSGEIMFKFLGENLYNWRGSFKFTSSTERGIEIDEILKSINLPKPHLANKIRFVIDELITNALTHGAANGALLHIEKTSKGVWIKVLDQKGDFNREVVNKLYSSIWEDSLTPSEESKSAGIGLSMILKMIDHFLIFQHPGHATVVGCYVPLSEVDEIQSFTFLSDVKNHIQLDVSKLLY